MSYQRVSSLFLLMICPVAGFAADANPPQLPRTFLDTSLPASSATCTIHVSANGDLQGAINQARPGDTICLQAGATWVGNYTLPNQSAGSGWITIRTATPDAQFVQPGTRVKPSDAVNMATVLTPNVGPVFVTVGNAHNYRLIGLEIAITANPTPPPPAYVNYALIQFTNQNAVVVADVPHNLVVDRCYIHGNSVLASKRGVETNSANTAVVDSYISEIHNIGQDTQAIGGWAGPGPFKIVNNFLEAAGENVLFGGAEAGSPALSPQDGEIRNNYFYKPLSWNPADPSYAGIHWEVKNLFEMKNGQRFLLDGNILENNWPDAQSGFGIFLQGLPNEDGLFAVVTDVTFTNNIIRNSYSGVAFCGQCLYAPVQTTNPSLPNYADPTVNRVQRVFFGNNLFDTISHLAWSPGGNLADIGWNHNTIVNPSAAGNDLAVYDVPVSVRMDFTNNVGFLNAYGFYGNDSVPFASLLQNYTLTGNLLVDNQGKGYSAASFPPGNSVAALTPSNVFVQYSSVVGGNYHLAAGSPFSGSGTDGLDPGANINTLNAATANVVAGLDAAEYTTVTISNVAESPAGAASETITWNTNLPANSQVVYGTSTAYGASTGTLDAAGVTLHSVVLSALSANTTYHFRVSSQGASGNPAASGDFVFTTGSPAPPVISAVSATEVTALSAVITWNTDQAATSQVNYGLTSSYGTSTSIADLTGVTSHSVVLTNLTPAAVYHYQVSSQNMTGRAAVSSDYTFTTADVITVPPASSSWYLSTPSGAPWPFRKQITINHADVSGASGLSNFPVLVSVTDPDLTNTASAQGLDIVFTDVNGVKLSHEIESFQQTTGSLVAWVGVPSLPSSADTTIYLYFGNPNAGNQQNINGVWDANFKGVWHHSDRAVATTLTDSTASPANGVLTAPASAKSTTGKIGFALIYNGTTDYASIGSVVPVKLNPTQYASWTAEAWINPTDCTNNNYPTIYGYGWFQASLGLTNTCQLSSWHGLSLESSLGTLPVGGWTHVAVVQTPATTTFFINGALVGSQSSTSTPTAGGYMYLGSTGPGYYPFAGILDEVRFSSTARSANWLATQYQNQNSPNQFLSLGPLETYGGVQNNASSMVPARGIFKPGR